MKHGSDINIYGCTESKDWDPGSNEGKDKTPLDFCRTGISPGWFLSPPAMWWFSHAHVHFGHLFAVVSPFLPSRAKSCFPSIHPHAPSLARHPQTVPPSCQLTEASISFNQEGESGGQQFSVPASAIPLPSRFRLFNPPVSLENQEGGIGAMSETNILFWVQVCQ